MNSDNVVDPKLVTVTKCMYVAALAVGATVLWVTLTGCTGVTATGEDGCTLYQLADTTSKQCIYTSRESQEVLTSKRHPLVSCRLSLCAEEVDTVTLVVGEDSALVNLK